MDALYNYPGKIKIISWNEHMHRTCFRHASRFPKCLPLRHTVTVTSVSP